MSVLSDRRLGWLSVAVVVVVLGLVGVAGVGAVAVLSAIASVAAGESVVLVLLRTAIPFLVALAALSVLAAALLAWLVVRAVRLAELPRNERLEAVARGVEQRVPWLEDGHVSERVAPTVADRRDALKQRYADGELSEREFERELEALLDEHDDAATNWSTTGADDAFDRELADELDLGDADREREESSAVDPDRDGPSAFERERR
jgi:hypothetical protein